MLSSVSHTRGALRKKKKDWDFEVIDQPGVVKKSRAEFMNFKVKAYMRKETETIFIKTFLRVRLRSE